MKREVARRGGAGTWDGETGRERNGEGNEKKSEERKRDGEKMKHREKEGKINPGRRKY